MNQRLCNIVVVALMMLGLFGYLYFEWRKDQVIEVNRQATELNRAYIDEAHADLITFASNLREEAAQIRLELVDATADASANAQLYSDIGFENARSRFDSLQYDADQLHATVLSLGKSLNELAEYHFQVSEQHNRLVAFVEYIAGLLAEHMQLPDREG